jgi:hypothetical protein
VNVLWLRDGTYALLGLQAFAVGTSATVIDLPAVAPPTDGPYHLQVEFGQAAAGTVLTFDDFVVTNSAGGVVSPPPPPPPPSGVVVAAASEDFASAGPYKYALAQFAGAAAGASFAGGAATVTVNTKSTEQWHLQLVSPFIPLSASGRYSARFSARASAPTTVNVLWLRDGTYALLGLQAFAVGTSATVIDLPAVTPPTDGPYHLQVEFGQAAAGTVLTFDDFVVAQL